MGGISWIRKGDDKAAVVLITGQWGFLRFTHQQYLMLIRLHHGRRFEHRDLSFLSIPFFF